MNADHDTEVSFHYLMVRAVRSLAEIPEDKATGIANGLIKFLCQYSGGVYIPKSEIHKPARNRQIRAAFNGRNHAEVMARFRISRRTLYRVIGER